MIDYQLKLKCVAAAETMTAREIYETIFKPEANEDWSLENFKRRLREWKHKKLADELTLENGTYPGFTTHSATVLMTNEGVIIARQCYTHEI